MMSDLEMSDAQLIFMISNVLMSHLKFSSFIDL